MPLKGILQKLGAIFVVLLLAAGGFAIYLVSEGSRLDASSKAYVDKVVPQIVKSWSADRLLAEISTDLRQSVEADEVTALLGKFSVLGPLVAYEVAEGESRTSLTLRRGKVVTAKYVARVKCVNGDVSIDVSLVQEGGQWRIANFYVNKPTNLRRPFTPENTRSKSLPSASQVVAADASG